MNKIVSIVTIFVLMGLRPLRCCLCPVLLVASVLGVQLEFAYPNLFFVRPVDLQHSPDNSARIFVVTQEGVISVFPHDPDVAQASVFLDIQNKVDDSGNEMGLLGLAFHPEYSENGYFFVDYTAG